MNPSDANSPLATLRQLKELLDAGTLTPQEFEALKQKLVFGNEAVAPTAPAPASAPFIASPSVSEAFTPPTSFLAEEVPVSLPPTDNLAWPSAPAPPLVEGTAYPELPDEATERRNPLTLVFIIGGVLVLLGLVLYLALGNRSSDEHVTSTSQTAADSTAVAPEIGPQAQQITLPAATAPETVRVAPALPPATVPSQFRRDTVLAPASATTPAATAPAVSTPAPVKATPKAASPAPAPATTPADTATTKSGQP